MNRSYQDTLTDMVIFESPDGTPGRPSSSSTASIWYLATDQGMRGSDRSALFFSAGAFFELRDGKAARITIYYNVKDWITSVTGEAK